MRKLILCLLFFVFQSASFTQAPEIGAQIWIEPGQTQEQIDHWFKMLKENKMPVARLFMQWNFIETEPDVWDFTLYDEAFKAAEKHGVQIIATLTTNQGPAHADPLYKYQLHRKDLPVSFHQMQIADLYIEKTVERYCVHPALDTWMLMNEPTYDSFQQELGIFHFRKWLKEKYQNIAALNKIWITNFSTFDNIEFDYIWVNPGGFFSQQSYLDWHYFRVDFLSWHMKHIADEIRKIDKEHEIHVNPHAMLDNFHVYKLSEWMDFLTSIGASIHPTHHFKLLKREEFPLGVSVTCDMIKGASAPKPFWVTELQGGVNTYSGGVPVCPSVNDINQWVWTSVFSGAKRIIFWCLNHRMQGKEAGEWAMLTSQGLPSDRVIASKEIAETIEAHPDFFNDAIPVSSPVTVAVSSETMFIQQHKESINRNNKTSDRRIHAKAYLAMSKVLTGLGISPDVQYMDDIPWEEKSNVPKVVIIPHAVSLTRAQVNQMKTFVENGNKIIITGLSGIFDENEKSTIYTDFYLNELVGGVIKEIRYDQENYMISLNDPEIQLPSTSWYCDIAPDNGNILAKRENKIIALRNHIGQGEVVWIPSLISIRAWNDADYEALATYLAQEIQPVKKTIPFSFNQYYDNCLMRTMHKDNHYATMIINTSQQNQNVRLNYDESMHSKRILGNQKVRDHHILLNPNDLVILFWE